MGTNGFLAVILAVGGILLAVPVVFSILGTKADVNVYTAIVGVTLVLVACVFRASNILVKFEKVLDDQIISGKLSLNKPRDQKE